MSRIVRIIVWAVILFAFYFFLSTVFKSCGNKSNSDAKSTADTELIDENYDDSEDEFFEDTGDDLLDSDESLDKETPDVKQNKKEFEEPAASSAVAKPKSNDSAADSKKPSAPQKQVKPYSAGNYLVIAGSFLMETNANAMVKKLKNMGYSNAEMIIFEASQYHTVTSGRYASRSDANATAQKLKSSGVDCYVHRIN